MRKWHENKLHYVKLRIRYFTSDSNYVDDPGKAEENKRLVKWWINSVKLQFMPQRGSRGWLLS